MFIFVLKTDEVSWPKRAEDEKVTLGIAKVDNKTKWSEVGGEQKVHRVTEKRIDTHRIKAWAKEGQKSRSHPLSFTDSHRHLS